MKKFELGSLMCAVILGTYFLSGTVYAEESLSEFVLDGINVTALGYEKNNLDTPADTVIYTGEQLKETGASDVANDVGGDFTVELEYQLMCGMSLDRAFELAAAAGWPAVKKFLAFIDGCRDGVYEYDDSMVAEARQLIMDGMS